MLEPGKKEPGVDFPEIGQFTEKGAGFQREVPQVRASRLQISGSKTHRAKQGSQQREPRGAAHCTHA